MKQVFLSSVILLLFIFQSPPLRSQVPDLEWSRCYGGTLSDWGEYLFPLQDSTFLMTGSSRSDDNDVSGHHSNGYYVGYDYWIARVKWDGTILWQNSYGGTQTDLGRGIVQPDAAHFVISGYAISNDYDIAGNHGYYDLWLLNIDTAGNLIWGKTYGGTNEDDNWDLIETSDHGFLLTGATLSVNGDITNPHGAYDSWVVKTDSLGNLEWQKTFGGNSNEYFNQTIETADSNYLSVGRTFSNNGDVSQQIGNGDVWVVKYDDTGTIIWEKTFGGSDFEEAQGVVAVAGGGYTITGSTYSNDVNVSGNHGYSDVWVINIDESGNLLWQYCYGGTSDETSWGISSVTGGYLVSGESFSADGDVTNNYGGKDGWIISIDASGNLLGQKNFGGSGEDWMRMVKTTSTSDMFSIGTSTSNDYDAINAHGDYDFFVMKFLPSCQPVAANFSFQPNGEAFTFSDNSDNATQWFWDFGDGDTSIDQNPVHEFLISGEYTICLIAGNSCSSDTFCITIKVVATSSQSFAIDDAPFTIFPNPFSGTTIFQFSTLEKSPTEINLLDLQGSKIKTISEGNFFEGNHSIHFSAEDLPQGLYLLQLKTDSGIAIQKLIIQ